MLDMARKRAEKEGLLNLDLRVMDAASLEELMDASFDAVLSRWGLMYMESPLHALRASARCLVPKGLFVAAVWAEPEHVPYFSLPRQVLAKYRSIPLLDRDAPGTFRYASVSRLVDDFRSSGFVVDDVEEIQVPVVEAKTTDELIAWVRAFGLTLLLNDLSKTLQLAWEADFAREVEDLRHDGLLALGGLTRIVVAHRPG